MENTKKMSSVSSFGGESLDAKKSIPVNIIRQLPERPGEWSKKRLIVFVCTDSDLSKAAND